MPSDIDTLRQQLQQLKRQHERGSLPRDAYDARRTELERQLVAQVMQAGSGQAAAAARPSRRLWLGVTAWAIALAAAGYAWKGSPDGLGPVPAPEMAAAPSPGAEQVAAMVDRLAARLREKPDDAVGWAMLARSYAVLGRNAESLPAYAKAVALKSDDAGLLADYAAALAMSNQRDMTGKPLELVERALALEPDNLKALSLAGMAAFDRRDYAAAVLRWERILTLSPSDPELVQQVQASVAEARELGKMPPSAPVPMAASPVVAAAGDAGVSGVVTLAAALAGQAGPTDTVFVFARAAEGSRMPLAVLRKQVKDLPLAFKLDDSLAMSPAARLSMHARVLVSARISKSGNATPQPGDLVAAAVPASAGASGVKLQISQTVPN